MIEKFIERQKINRNSPKNTTDNYNRVLKKFEDYLQRMYGGDVSLYTPETVKFYHIDQRIAIQRINKTIKTCNLYVGAIRSFLRFCLYMERAVINYKGVNFSKEPEKNIEYLTDENIESIFQEIKKRKTKNKNQILIKIRDLCIVKLLFYTGLRISELLNLKVSDLDDEIIQIVGKGGVHRVVFIKRGSEEKKLLEYYLRLRKDKEERLFINHCNNYEGKLSSVSIERMIRESAEAAGCSERIFPHKLRHTFATELLKNDVNLPTIQKLMGHKNLTTTQKYLTIEDSELKRAMETLKF